MPHAAPRLRLCVPKTPLSGTAFPLARASVTQGFTLIEVVVVVLIAGLLFGFAVLSIGVGTSRQIEVEGRRLIELASLARDESLLGGQTRALGFSRDGYAFLEQVLIDDNTLIWIALERAPLHPRSLVRHGLELRLLQAGRVVPLGDRAELPHVLFNSAGELTPFELEMRRSGPGGEALRITGSLAGSMSQERLR